MGILLALGGALGFSFMNVFVRNGVRPDDPDNGLIISMIGTSSSSPPWPW